MTQARRDRYLESGPGDGPPAPPITAGPVRSPDRRLHIRVAHRRRRSPLAPRWASLLHVLSLAIGGIYVLRIDHRMWFWFDDWDFVGDRGVFHSRLGLLVPHNDHWSTLPILAYRALLSVFGMRSYLPFLVLLVALHLALCHILWRVSLRMGARPLQATVLAAVFVVLGSGFQNLGWAFEMGFVGSVLFGWVWLWITDHDGGLGTRDIAGWGAGLASLMCSGIGVPMLAATAIAVSLRRDLRRAAAAVSVPAAAFLLWYGVYGRHARRSAPITKTTLFQIGTYAWSGIENAFSSAVGFTGAGAVVAAALLFAWLRRPLRRHPSDAIGRAATITVVLAFLFIAIGRSGLGIDQADRSRYVYIAIALVLPAAAVLLSDLFRPTLGHALVFLLLCGVVGIINANDLRSQESGYSNLVDTAKQQILGSYDLANGGGYVFAEAPTAAYAGPQPTVATLRQIRRSGWLDASYPVPPSVLLADQARMQVGVLPPGRPGPASVPAHLAGLAHLTSSHGMPGCLTLAPDGSPPTVALAPATGPVVLTITPAVPGTLRGTLASGGNQAAFSPLHLAGATRVLVAAPDVATVLELPPAGTTTICGLAPG